MSSTLKLCFVFCLYSSPNVSCNRLETLTKASASALLRSGSQSWHLCLIMMLSKWFCLVLMILLLVKEVRSQLICHSHSILEAEAGNGGKNNHRSSASGGLAVALAQGEVIIQDIYSDRACIIKLNSIQGCDTSHPW